jgi:glutamate dehydrogenase (NAD(P)+)
MDDPFGFADSYGPAKIIHIHRPSMSLKAVVAVTIQPAG